MEFLCIPNPIWITNLKIQSTDEIQKTDYSYLIHYHIIIRKMCGRQLNTKYNLETKYSRLENSTMQTFFSNGK